MNTLVTTTVGLHATAALIRILVAGALFTPTASALADDAECARNEQLGFELGNRASLVIPQLAPACYGVKDEQHPLTQEIFALIVRQPPTDRVAVALTTLAARVRDGDLYGAHTTREAFAQSALGAADDVVRNVAPGDGRIRPVDWKIRDGAAKAVPGVNLIALLDEGCPAGADPATAPCKNAIDSAKAWFRVVQLTEATLTSYSASAINDLLTRSTNRLAMWHAYRDEALPQFPWEWFVNSWRLNKADKGPNGRPRDAHNQPRGPMKVPTDQIIVLHPGVGLEYRNDPDEQLPAGADDSKTAPIIYLEILGRYRWAWDESTGAMRGGSGVSLVATYADREHDTEVGYGLMFHSRFSKTYTLGVTRSGDATNIIFNVDLAQFFKDKLSYWRGVDRAAAQ
jgi:hypothetical protein